MDPKGILEYKQESTAEQIKRFQYELVEATYDRQATRHVYMCWDTTIELVNAIRQAAITLVAGVNVEYFDETMGASSLMTTQVLQEQLRDLPIHCNPLNLRPVDKHTRISDLDHTNSLLFTLDVRGTDPYPPGVPQRMSLPPLPMQVASDQPIPPNIQSALDTLDHTLLTQSMVKMKMEPQPERKQDTKTSSSSHSFTHSTRPCTNPLDVQSDMARPQRMDPLPEDREKLAITGRPVYACELSWLPFGDQMMMDWLFDVKPCIAPQDAFIVLAYLQPEDHLRVTLRATRKMPLDGGRRCAVGQIFHKEEPLINSKQSRIPRDKALNLIRACGKRPEGSVFSMDIEECGGMALMKADKAYRCTECNVCQDLIEVSRAPEKERRYVMTIESDGDKNPEWILQQAARVVLAEAKRKERSRRRQQQGRK